MRKKTKTQRKLGPNIDDSKRILINGDSEPGNKNIITNLIRHQLDNDKIYLYAKDPYEEK